MAHELCTGDTFDLHFTQNPKCEVSLYVRCGVRGQITLETRLTTTLRWPRCTEVVHEPDCIPP